MDYEFPQDVKNRRSAYYWRKDADADHVFRPAKSGQQCVREKGSVQ